MQSDIAQRFFHSISLPLSGLRLTVLQLRHAPHLVSDTIYSSAAFTMDVHVHVHVYVVTESGSRRQAFNSRNEKGFADPHFSLHATWWFEDWGFKVKVTRFFLLGLTGSCFGSIRSQFSLPFAWRFMSKAYFTGFLVSFPIIVTVLSPGIDCIHTALTWLMCSVQ